MSRDNLEEKGVLVDFLKIYFGFMSIALRKKSRNFSRFLKGFLSQKTLITTSYFENDII